ncbi:MAG: thioredoxin domain-containing protein, partial [Leptolyngbyaceae cyanobacterium SL_7_1]|nr:thioredoxin domain-containing protein [Leptolyngbyaceae cyanobacterium SL_7_1]
KSSLTSTSGGVELGGYYNTECPRWIWWCESAALTTNCHPLCQWRGDRNLVRLFLLTEDIQYLDRAEQALEAFSGVMNRAAQSCPTLFVALDWFRNQTLVRTAADAIPGLMAQYVPVVSFRADTHLPPESIGLVCQGVSCKEPARTLGQMQTQLERSVRRSS